MPKQLQPPSEMSEMPGRASPKWDLSGFWRHPSLLFGTGETYIVSTVSVVLCIHSTYIDHRLASKAKAEHKHMSVCTSMDALLLGIVQDDILNN